LLVAGLSVAAAIGFAFLVRLPLPFDGFAAVVAAGLAGGLTLALGLLAPASWIWTDTERLRHAFRVMHNISDIRTNLVLEAITLAHRRAQAMRSAASSFSEPLKTRTLTLADRMDAIAHEIFYDPKALSVHRESLIRSELIEDAVVTHSSLRRRSKAESNAEQIAESRVKITAALDALEAAFDKNEARMADKLLQQVDVSSATAELLLRRRAT
jgi:hypothetical protein